MPETVLNPTANGTETNFSLPGGAGYAKWQGVLNPDDGDATYIQQDHHVGTSAMTFVMEDLPGAAQNVISHTVRHRARRDTTTSPPTKLNGVLKLSGTIIGPVDGGPYAKRRPELYYKDFLTPDLAKPDLTAWTVADVNSAEAGVRLVGVDAAENVRVTTVDWTVKWGGTSAPIRTTFGLFVASLVGPVIGAAIGLHEIPKLAGLAWAMSRGKHRILADEYRDLWLSLRAPRRIYV